MIEWPQQDYERLRKLEANDKIFREALRVISTQPDYTYPEQMVWVAKQALVNAVKENNNER